MISFIIDTPTKTNPYREQIGAGGKGRNEERLLMKIRYPSEMMKYFGTT